MAWNGSNGASAPKQKPTNGARTVSKGAIAGVIVVLGAAAALYFLMPASAPTPKASAPKEKSTAIAEVAPEIAEKVEVKNVEELIKTEMPITNVITARTSRAGRVMTLMDGTVVTNRSKVIFTRDFEKGLLVAMRPGGISGGLINKIRHKYTDHEIVQMLKEMTVPDPGDDDETRRAKIGVQKAKEEFLIALDDGMSVSEVLDQIRRRGVFESRMKSDAMRIRAEALRTGDEQLIRDRVEEANAILERGGIRGLSMPYGIEKVPAENSSFENSVGCED